MDNKIDFVNDKEELFDKMIEHFGKKGSMYFWDFRANNMSNE